MADKEEAKAKSVFDENFINKTTITEGSTAEDTQQLYNKWAMTYDQDLTKHGYTLGHESANAFKEYADKLSLGFDISILDVACGTGILGELLTAKGFEKIDGLDLSEEMLKVAASKKVYSQLFQSKIGDGHTVKVADNSYDAIICIGGLSTGHIKSDAIREFVRLVKKGGMIHLSIRKSMVDRHEGGYKEVIDDLITNNLINLIAQNATEIFHDVALEEFKQCYLFTCVVS